MATRWKTIQVFICSTFGDMHSERDHLVRVVFPELRQRLETHRIHLIDVDLRWGVTAEQSNHHQALGLCLDLIDECRPFFVGILGERYGWVPKRLDGPGRHAWLGSHQGKSITHLEILHGVLRDPAMRSRSFFYFRDPAFAADVPPAQRSHVAATDDEAAGKLRLLKEEIRSAGLPHTEDYPCRYAGLRVSPHLASLELHGEDRESLRAASRGGMVVALHALKGAAREFVETHGHVQLAGLGEFGRGVRDDLWESFCEVYPELNETAREPLPLETQDPEAEEHDRFAESRTRVYVGREGALSDLLAHALGDDAVPLCIHGPSGSGKSALLSRLYQELRKDSAWVLAHFVGASTRSTSLPAMLRRICSAIRDRYSLVKIIEQDADEEGEKRPSIEIPMPIPDDVESLPGAFAAFLQAVPASERAVLLIDAVDQLDETGRAHELAWLPRTLPGHVRILLTCSEASPVFERLHPRGVRPYPLAPLTAEERASIVELVPSLSAKTLDAEQVAILLSNPATENPLFLLVALEELRGFGSFEHLPARIRALPRGENSATAIFDQVLERLEQDSGAVLVETMASLLAVSRGGLTEGELADLSGADPEECYAVLRQLRAYLQKRADRVDFQHSNLAAAARNRYLKEAEASHARHVQLARYFEELGNRTVRATSELPYHLAQANLCADLENILTDIGFLQAKLEHGFSFDLLADYDRACGLPGAPETLELFATFLRREFHLLRARPDLTYQQARNWPDKSAPVRSAAGIDPEPVWFRWVNKPQQLDPCLATLVGVGPPCSFSPNGRRILTASRVFRADNHEELGRIERGAMFACSPDGASIACGAPPVSYFSTSTDDEPVLRLLDADSLEERWRAEELFPPFAFSPDSRFLLACGPNHALQILDTRCGTIHATLEGHRSAATGCAYSPDGRRIASRGGDLRIWRADSGACEAILSAGSSTAPAWLPDSIRLLSGGIDPGGPPGLVIWGTRTGEVLTRFDSAEDVSAVAVSPDGLKIVGALGDRLALWDADTGRRLALFVGHTGEVVSCAFSPDGHRILSGSFDQTARIWDAEHRSAAEETIGSEGAVKNCVFSPDGNRVACAVDGAGLGFWDLRQQRVTPIRARPGAGRVGAFSPDGTRFVSSESHGVATVREAASGDEIHQLFGPRNPIKSLAYSPDGRYVVAGTKNFLFCWDEQVRRLVAVLGTYDLYSTACAYSPDGRWILTGSTRGSLQLWVPGNPRPAATWQGHSDEVGSCAFSPDGRRVVTCSRSDGAKLWKVASQEQVGRVGAEGMRARSCGFSASGRFIYALSQRGLQLFDARTGTEVAMFRTALTSVTEAPAGPIFFAGAVTGPACVLELNGIRDDAPLLTAVHSYDGEANDWEGEPSALCGWCGARQALPADLLKAIDEAKRGDPRLTASCADCDQPLRFNPFRVDPRRFSTLLGSAFSGDAEALAAEGAISRHELRNDSEEIERKKALETPLQFQPGGLRVVDKEPCVRFDVDTPSPLLDPTAWARFTTFYLPEGAVLSCVLTLRAGDDRTWFQRRLFDVSDRRVCDYLCSMLGEPGWTVEVRLTGHLPQRLHVNMEDSGLEDELCSALYHNHLLETPVDSAAAMECAVAAFAPGTGPFDRWDTLAATGVGHDPAKILAQPLESWFSSVRQQPTGKSALYRLYPNPEHPPIVRHLDALLLRAAQVSCSEIHIEPRPQQSRIAIRMVTPDKLRNEPSLPIDRLAGTMSRLKIIGQLDITERNRPQLGRLLIVHRGAVHEAVLLTHPTPFGEGAMLRFPERVDLTPAALDTFVRRYTADHRITIALVETGDQYVADLNAAFRDRVVGHLLDVASAPTGLLRDLLVECARSSTVTHRMPREIVPLAAALLARRDAGVLDDFVDALTISFQLRTACHRMDLPRGLLESRAAEIDRRFDALATAAERARWEFTRDLFRRLLAPPDAFS